MADAGTGLLVTSHVRPSLNANNGDWSAGVSGFWFRERRDRLAGQRRHRRGQSRRPLDPAGTRFDLEFAAASTARP
jgi:hypothetical protein